MNDDLTAALGDLAGTMTDDPQRLTAVHRKARQLRARRTARRGVVATGALGVAAATGVLLRPSGSSPDTRVAATQPTEPTEPSTPPTTSCSSAPTSTPPTTWPEDAYPILTSFTDARVLSVQGDDVTFEVLDRPADSALPATMTLTLGPDVEYADGHTPLDGADLVPGQVVEILVQQPQGEIGWGLAHVQIDPLDATEPC